MGAFSLGLPVKNKRILRVPHHQRNPIPAITQSTYSFISDNNSSESNVKASTFSLFFGLLSASALIWAIRVHNFSPELSYGREDSEASLRKFDARQVYRNLETLSVIGPRVPGTYEYEVLAINFLIEKIKEAQNGTEGFANTIEYDVQTANGYYHGFRDDFCRFYDRVRNIVVRIKPKNVENTESILVNAHFDTEHSSPGTSDDGVPCTIMLEFLKVLATKEEPLNKNIIFLFNGAGGNRWKGSHAFIKQHKWAKNITYLVNLDACGAGGREILFHTRTDNLVLQDIYAESAPYPHGTVLFEEFLGYSLIFPTDAVYERFRDMDNTDGIYFAHYKNGYVYRTSSDNVSFVSARTIQHTGSNILTLLHSLVDSGNRARGQGTELDPRRAPVYFDIFGIFMVYYTRSTGIIVNIAVIILSIAATTRVNINIFGKRKVTSLLYHCGMNTAFVGVGIFFVAVVTYGLVRLLEFYGLIMLWYAQPWFAFAYYGIPTLFVLTAALKLRRTLFNSTITLEEEFLVFLTIVQIVGAVLLLAAVDDDVRTGYILSIELVAVCVSSLLNCTIFKNAKVGLRIFVHFVCNSVPFVYVTYLAVTVFELLVPILGRMGATAYYSEWIMCVACVATVVQLFSSFMPLVLLVEKFWKIQLTVALAYIGFVSVVLFGSILQPFSDGAPQRFEVLHVNRKIAHPGSALKSESSGFFVVGVDPRASQTVNALFDKQSFQPVTDLCAGKLLCDMPVFEKPYADEHFDQGFWFPSATKPKFPGTKSVNVTWRDDHLYGTRTYFFSISGPPHSTVLIQQLNNGSAWSDYSCGSDGIYFFHYVRGPEEMGDTPWTFSVMFSMKETAPESPIFKLIWSAHYRTNNTDHYESSFRDLIDKFPTWTSVSSWVTDFEEYVF